MNKEIEFTPQIQTLATLLPDKGIKDVEELVKALLKEHQNICFTGKPGTGKLTVMKTCISYIKDEDYIIFHNNMVSDSFLDGGAIIFQGYYGINSTIKDICDIEIHMARCNDVDNIYIESITRLIPSCDSTEKHNPIILAEYCNGEYILRNNLPAGK